MISEIKHFIESRDALAKQALVQYQPIVEQFITENCQNSNQLSYNLDFMLDFCFDGQMLMLYRKLCRHLYGIDPSAAADYINAYREMWDEEGMQFGNNKKNLS
ncbi:MAG: hypothetical protein SGJ02_07815 [bacterium]|nr:hypothetical protein [bacterium]